VWYKGRVRLPRPVAIVLSAVLAFDASARVWTEVVRSGNPAPGFPGEPDVKSLYALPDLADDGSVLFFSNLYEYSDPLVPFRIHRWRAGEIASPFEFVSEGSPFRPSPLLYDANGGEAWAMTNFTPTFEIFCEDVVFSRAVETTVRSDGSGGVETLARSGDAVVGAAEDLLYVGVDGWGHPFHSYTDLTIARLSVARTGAVAWAAGFGTYACDPFARRAIVAAPPSSPAQLVALVGDAAPGMDEGVTFADLALSASAVADDGKVVFGAIVEASAGIAPVVYQWDPSSGLMPVVTLAGVDLRAPSEWRWMLSLPVSSAGGTIGVFSENTVARRLPESEPEILYEPGVVVPRVEEGQRLARPPVLVIGTGSDRKLHEWINDRGDLAFYAYVTEEDTYGYDEVVAEGLFLARLGGSIETVALADDPAPGGSGETLISPRLLALGEQGEVMFRSDLRVPGAPSSQQRRTAVFLYDRDAGLRMVVSPAELATLLPASPAPADHGGGVISIDRALSRILIASRNQDRTVSLLVAAVPEPSAINAAAAVLLALSAARAARRPRRRHIDPRCGVPGGPAARSAHRVRTAPPPPPA
jgi:hypothetical protein